VWILLFLNGSRDAGCDQKPIFAVEWEEPVLVDFGHNPSIRGASKGKPLIAYAKSADGHDWLKLAQRLEESWSDEVILDTEKVHTCVLSPDLFNTPSVACILGATEVVCSRRTEKDLWELESLGDCGADVAFVHSPVGEPNLLLTDYESSSGLSHVFHARSDWFAEMVDPNIEPGHGISLDISTSGTIHAVFYDSSIRTLRYAWKERGEAWRFESIVSDASAAIFVPRVQVDTLGTVHVVYCHQAPAADGATVRYVFRRDGVWMPAVDLSAAGGITRLAKGQSNVPLTLDLDPSDRPWVAFEPLSGDISLAVWNSAFWESISFSRPGNHILSDYHVSMVVDRRGGIHLACSFSDNGGETKVYYFRGILKKVPHCTDYNQDGFVDEQDLMMLLPGWGQ